MGKYEKEGNMYKGVSQEGILSPILYSIYVKDLKNIFLPGTKISQYADDVLYNI